MALLGFDGFDNYSSKLDILSRTGSKIIYGSAIFNGLMQSDSGGRGGFGSCLRHQAFYMSVTNASQLLTIGFAHNPSPVIIPEDYAIGFYVGNTKICGTVLLKTDGSIEAYDCNDALVATIGADSYNTSGWCFIEVQLFADHLDGYIRVRINNYLVMEMFHIDTYYTGTPQPDPAITQVGFGLGGLKTDGIVVPAFWSSMTYLMDDLYVTNGDPQESSFNVTGFLGNMRTATLKPRANNGVDWTPLSSTNFQMVNVTHFNGGTTYNTSDGSGSKDSFLMQTVSGILGEVVAVQIVGAYVNMTGDYVDSTAQITQKLLSNGEEAAGISFFPDVAFAFWADLFIRNPNTSASWTASEVNSLIVSYEVS